MVAMSIDEPVPRSARERARREITADLLAIARRHLAEVGGAALSLRAVARDAGMVSSAVYRYFPSRDDLLTRLIGDAFGEVAERVAIAAESAASSAPEKRFAAVAHAVRSWAHESPHDYALIYGTPIPGYVAPPETAQASERIVRTLCGVLAEAASNGQVRTDARIETTRAVRSDLAALRALAEGLDDATLARAVAWWTGLLGHISFELFGHLANGLDSDPDGFFALQIGLATTWLLQG